MVSEVVGALIRRWYLVILGAVVSAAMVLGAQSSSPPTYEARGLVLMLPSPVAIGKGGNPLLVLDGLEQPAGILVAHYASSSARDEIAEISPTAEFTVLLDESVRGPVIAVDVKDISPEATSAVLRHLMADIPKQLVTLQQQVQASNNSYIRSMPLTVDGTPSEDRSATLRLMIAALMAGLVATVVGTFSIDSLLEQRRGRRRGHPRRTTATSLGTESEESVLVANGSQPQDASRARSGTADSHPSPTEDRTPPPCTDENEKESRRSLRHAGRLAEKVDGVGAPRS